MSKIIKVRDVKIGVGMPKICAPIVGRTKKEIYKSAQAVSRAGVDLAEWRADWFSEVSDLKQVEAVLDELRYILNEIPLLFTFRTAKEGGERVISEDTYVELNKLAVDSDAVDLIDVEMFRDRNNVHRIVQYAHQNRKIVVGSNHDFGKTPTGPEMIGRLLEMQNRDADICKLAVMPKKKSDVLELLQITEKMSMHYADRPIVTMSMGGEGLISRLSGEAFGSAITFGSVGQASAPGQIEVKQLKQILEIIHENM